MDEKVLETPGISRKRSPLFFVWVGVVVLFCANIGLLFFLSSGSDDRAELGKAIEDDQQAFDQLSFWEQFLQGNSTSAADHKLSAFDGLEIDPEYEESVVSVMIDNFVTARPQQSGVRSASIVYEALAEGGITRLMLVFPYQEISRVGPVRSARDYFVDFAEEYGGLYVHAGGSPAALEKLYASQRVFELDEDDRLEGETYSFRDLQYPAPHNLFFDLLLAREWATAKEWQLPAAESNWCFESEAFTGTPVETLRLDFANDPLSDSYVQFVYDAQQQHYKRFYGSARLTPHTDQLDALQVAPTNVIVQVAPSHLIDGDEKERLSMQHIGQGKAFYYRNGQRTVGTWEKTSEASPTRFFDDQGTPICLHPGQTWIAIVDSEDLIREEI